jgi:hypothetical protein
MFQQFYFVSQNYTLQYEAGTRFCCKCEDKIVLLAFNFVEGVAL